MSGDPNLAPSSERCPACDHAPVRVFHEEPSVPVSSNLLLADRSEAVEFPRGTIRLGFCPDCGFISNTSFDPALGEYGERYEETQGFSARFLEFAGGLARGWVDRYGLEGKRVLEIGCGKGEFLVLMAEEGIGSGVGIDPGIKPDRIVAPAADRIEWHARYFTPDDSSLVGDAVVCRHTLEHIHGVAEFVRGLRHAIGDGREVVALFELPDSSRILDEVAFWDVYYEHTGYFTAGSLARLFERCGFEVMDLRLEYDDQYLILEARTVAPGEEPARWPVDDVAATAAGIEKFRGGYERMRTEWRNRLAALTADGGTAVVWGASSKAVAFLAGTGDHVAAAVDINPHKHGMYMAGTGHRIVAPDDLRDLAPDLVVAMNPIYLDEIQADLDRLGVEAELLGL